MFLVDMLPKIILEFLQKYNLFFNSLIKNVIFLNNLKNMSKKYILFARFKKLKVKKI